MVSKEVMELVCNYVTDPDSAVIIDEPNTWPVGLEFAAHQVVNYFNDVRDTTDQEYNAAERDLVLDAVWSLVQTDSFRAGIDKLVDDELEHVITWNTDK